MEPTDTQALVLAELQAMNARLARIEAQVQDMSRRQRALEDLVHEFGPVAREVYQALLQELSGVEGSFQLDDVVHLARKILRNTRRFSEMLDLLASAHDFLQDATPLGKEVMGAFVERLDELERKGGFAFAREAAGLVERILENFTPEDVRLLSTHVVDILKTTRSLTQPDVLRMVNTSLNTVRAEQPAPLGPWGLVQSLRDPQIQQGLGLALAMLRQFPTALATVSPQPKPEGA